MEEANGNGGEDDTGGHGKSENGCHFLHLRRKQVTHHRLRHHREELGRRGEWGQAWRRGQGGEGRRAWRRAWGAGKVSSPELVSLFLPRNVTVCNRTRCRREYDERGAGGSGEEAGEQREKAGEGEQAWRRATGKG